MDKVTRNAGYFLSRFRDECLKFLNGRSAGNYEETIKNIVKMIENDANTLFKKDEDLKQEKNKKNSKKN
ncbi:MAG: hypothetical protein HZC14_00960 [Candidatus Niyogibacteria bacterium]|nr:hypothetical protein [Candidatus Niyogibacteria bacterium]